MSHPHQEFSEASPSRGLLGAPKLIAFSLAAGTLAALVICLPDLVRLALAGDPAAAFRLDAASHFLGLFVVLGSVGGAIAGAALLALSGLRKAAGLVAFFGLLSAVLAYPAIQLGQRVLAGNGIAKHSQIDLLRFAVPVCLAVVAAVALLIVVGAFSQLRTRRSGSIWLATLALLSALVCLAAFYADARLLRTRSYDWFHVLLLPVSFLGAWWTCLHVFLSRRRSQALWLIAAAVILMGASAATLVNTSVSEGSRFALSNKTLFGGEALIVRDSLRPYSPPKIRVTATVQERLNAMISARKESVSSAEIEQRILLAKERSGRTKPWNVLWITVDTLRADHMGYAGYSRNTSPNIDSLAKRGTTFHSHWAQNPLTHDSFQSMFYGLYPGATPLRSKIEKAFPYKIIAERVLREKTFAGLMTEAGWKTVSVPALPKAARTAEIYKIFDRGFGESDPGPALIGRGAAKQLGRSVHWLRRAPQDPWFMWLHFFDPHEPYVKHKNHDFGTDTKSRYDSEIARVDDAVGRVLDTLREKGLDENTIIVFHADHGEALGDHGSDYHGSTLYEEQVHVPCIIRVPGLEPQKVLTPTENVDLFPTLLELNGIRPHQFVQGRSLIPLIVDGDQAAAPGLDIAYAELPGSEELSPEARGRYALRDGRYKILAGITPDGELLRPELYDLTKDAEEAENLAFGDPQLLAIYSSLLVAMKAETALACQALTAGEGDVETESARVARLLKEIQARGFGTRHQPLRLLIESNDKVLDELIPRRLASEDCHWSERVLLLCEGARRRGKLVIPYIKALIDARMPWVARAVALRAIGHLPPEDASGVVSDQKETIEKMVAGPHAVARLAARELVRNGVDYPPARALLLADVDGPDLRASFESILLLCHRAPANLPGELKASFIPAIKIGISASTNDPQQCSRALRVLGNLGDPDIITFLSELLSNRYLSHEIKSEAVSILAGYADQEIACAAWLNLLQGWDPGITKLARASLDKSIGVQRRKEWEAAARKLASARSVLQQGLNDQAEQQLLEVVALCGSEKAATIPTIELMRLRWLRLKSATDGSGLGRGGDQLMPSLQGLPPGLRRAADLLRSKPPRTEAHLLVEAVTPLFWVTPRPGVAIPCLARLKNVGNQPVAGGDWIGSPSWRLNWMQGDKVAASSPMPARLPIGGCLPGETIEVVVGGSLPGTPGVYRIRVQPWIRGAMSLRVEEAPSARTSEMVIGVPTDGGGMLGVGETLTLSGSDFLRSVFQKKPEIDPVVEKDGSISIIPTTVDAWFLGPQLRAASGRLEASLEFAVGTEGSAEQAGLAVFWGKTELPAFSASEFRVMTVPADGVMRKWTAVLPSEGPDAPRIVRFDPCEMPRLLRIKSFSLRRVDKDGK